MASVKNFIIHTTDARYKSLLTRLMNQGDYKRYFDGHEHTTTDAADAFTNPRDVTGDAPTGVKSTRYYFYNVPRGALTRMVRHLQNVKTRMSLSVQVKIGSMGNHSWD
jgi:hypothetical protein